MSKLKKVLLALLAVFVIIQFIRPARNEGDAYGENSISVAPEVKNILENSCYDCHSNKTDYPWYSNIQPVGWWLAKHVNKGKREVNFSEFNTYTRKRKLKKMKEIKEQIEEGEMPLNSYTLIHTRTVLTEEQKQVLLNWVAETKNKLNDTLGK